MTNYEKIKEMNLEEMEEFLCGLCADITLVLLGVTKTMRNPNLNWLMEEVEADG